MYSPNYNQPQGNFNNNGQYQVLRKVGSNGQNLNFSEGQFVGGRRPNVILQGGNNGGKYKDI